MHNQTSLIDHCKGCLSKKFGVNRTAIKTDMDAISILISTNDMTPEQRTGIKEFLNLFRNELTLRATLPNSVIESSTEGICGCRVDRKCMHLPPDYRTRKHWSYPHLLKLRCIDHVKNDCGRASRTMTFILHCLEITVCALIPNALQTQPTTTK